MVKEIINKGLGQGIYTIPSDPELIPQQAAQDSVGFISTDGQIELCRGRLLVGAEETASNYVQGEGWGYKADGTQIHFRKISTKIQYYNTSTSLWVDIVTGLTDNSEYSFAPYSSTAGTFMYATGIDGIFKMHTAALPSYIQMYGSSDVYRGYSIISTGRMLMWNLPTSKSGLYGSHKDGMELVTGNYRSVSGEATTSLTGTLGFKGGTATITIASPGVVTWNNHGLVAGDSLVFTTSGALPTGITAGTTYYVISAGLTTNSFEISATRGGSAINTSGGQSGTHTITTLKRNCFGVIITLTGSGEVYTDNLNGVLVGSLGGTGTIDYISGAYTMSNAGVGTARYQFEMSNNFGVTDFSYSATRVPLEGFILNQSEGGDFIQTVKPYDNKFYSIKDRTVYELTIDSTDTTFNNTVFRRNIGLQYWRSSVSTGKGIIFMDTSNPEKPKLTILQKNITGDNLEPQTLADQFDFSNYYWDMCAMDTYGEFIVFSGRSLLSDTNDKLFMYNVRRNTVDILPYQAKTITSSDGQLYIGDTLTSNVYEILTGFDDDDDTIENYWISSDDKYGAEVLKKTKKLRFKGLITHDQILEVYVSYDNNGFGLVGTIRGDGTYVDVSESYTIGSNGIGSSIIGGEPTTVDGYFYLAELKLSCPKFRKRTIKLVATGIGYVSVNMIEDWGIKTFQQRLPSKYRSKQNVSLDGTQTDVGAPYVVSVACWNGTGVLITFDQDMTGDPFSGWSLYCNGVLQSLHAISAWGTPTQLYLIVFGVAYTATDKLIVVYNSTTGDTEGVSLPLKSIPVLQSVGGTF